MACLRRIPRCVRSFIVSIRAGYAGIPMLAKSCSATRTIPALGFIGFPPPGSPSGESILTIRGLGFANVGLKDFFVRRIRNMSQPSFCWSSAMPVSLSPAVKSIPITLDPRGAW